MIAALWAISATLAVNALLMATARTRDLTQWQNFEQRMIERGQWKRCPICGAAMPSEAVLCIHCNHNVAGMAAQSHRPKGVPSL